MAPPPAINLAVSDAANFSVAPSSKIHTTNSSRSSEEERESTDGAVDEQHHHAVAVSGGAITGKRPRGRPPGSKNKPKTPTYVSVEPQDTLRPHILEIAPGADIPACLAAYARTRGRGVSIVYAVGSVAGLTFRQQSANPSSSNSLFLKGKQDIVSLSGTVLPDNTPLGPASLTVLVAGPHGQLIGGPVEGRLVAEGSVMVMATTFATATYEKLPLQVEAAPASSGLAGMGHNPGPSGPGVEDPRSGGYHPHPHPGLNMNMGIGGGGGPPETSSYANWYLQQQQQQQQLHNSNVRPPYMNN